MNSPAGPPVIQKRKRLGDVVQLLRQPIYSRKLMERRRLHQDARAYAGTGT